MKTKIGKAPALLFCLALFLCLIPAAFAESVESLTIPDGVTVIEAEAFYGCERITRVTIPASMKRIDDKAFALCTALEEVYFTGTHEQWNSIRVGSGNDPLTAARLICADDLHIGIMTGSIAQSMDDRLGAERFRDSYGADRVTLVTYPDNFMDNQAETVRILAGLAADPNMKAVIVNQAIPGTAEGFRRIKELCPDILCIAGEAHEDLAEIGSAADLVVNNDFIARGYLLVRSAHELGCDTFVHISFPRHMSYETMGRRVAVMKAACEEFGIKFVLETAPDPATDVGVAGAQAYILEKAPEWIEKYGRNAAFFCTNDAHVEPLIHRLLAYGGYFIESDLPSPLLGYPGALGLDLRSLGGDDAAILASVEQAVVAQGGAGRFGTWAYSYGSSLSAGLARHALNVLTGESELNSIGDLSAALESFTPNASWNGSEYADAPNTFLIYQDTYIMGNPGRYMGATDVEVPEKYFEIR